MKLTFALLLFHFYTVSAQQKPVETIYFEFDKYDLTEKQISVVSNFIKSIDTSKVESIQIYGYCDDRGKNDYNYTLSKNRVETVEKIIICSS